MSQEGIGGKKCKKEEGGTRKEGSEDKTKRRRLKKNLQLSRVPKEEVKVRKVNRRNL